MPSLAINNQDAHEHCSFYGHMVKPEWPLMGLTRRCVSFSFPSLSSAVSFPFSQWSELSGLDGQGGLQVYHSHNEAVFAYQRTWWKKVSTLQLVSCRTESVGGWEWKGHAGLAWLTFLLSSGWKLAPWKMMGDLQGSAGRSSRPLQEHQTLKRSVVPVHWYTAV